MPGPTSEQTDLQQSETCRGELRIGVDVGGTFTDLVASDGESLTIVKIPSSPPDYHVAVIEAAKRALDAVKGGGVAEMIARMVHGSTVATNALLQRAGEPVAFVTTDGFRDMLLIGRQNRPRLYALEIERPAPITPEENWFTVRERVDAQGKIIEALDDVEITRCVEAIRSRGLRHVAICLLFSFINPIHERKLGAACEAAGLSVSLSCDVLPEFREYERASTTAINASLRPTVQSYLRSLRDGLPGAIEDLRIMQSAGGTLGVTEASDQAAKLVLSGPAGGVMGAAFVARLADFTDVITYDMGGTSTDVALVLDGQPQWTTASTIDGLPIGLPMFDIHTVGAGGGSIAVLDAGGALRVGPKSAGAVPGPACYGRGGTLPTVTDANLVLGRIFPDQFLGGAMRVDPKLANDVIAKLAKSIGKTVHEAALGILRIAEANMARAVRAVTSRRGHDPRRFTLLSFGGAGGLHACAIAEALEIPRVLVPPYAGVLSALGMVVSPAVVDVSRTVVHLGEELDDARLAEEFGKLNEAARLQLGDSQTARTETFADVRLRGQSHELKIPVKGFERSVIAKEFERAYRAMYGDLRSDRPIEIVSLRLRRVGHEPRFTLPAMAADAAQESSSELIDSNGAPVRARVLSRRQCVDKQFDGPELIVDAEATTYVPANWTIMGKETGSIILERMN